MGHEANEKEHVSGEWREKKGLMYEIRFEWGGRRTKCKARV
jgi:hypothetical protein